MARNPYDEEDGSSTPGAGGMTAAQKAAAASNAQSNAAENNKPQDDWMSKAAGFIFGNGEDPGVLGTGMRKVDDSFTNLDTSRGRIQQGYDDARNYDYRTNNPFRDKQMTLAGDLLDASHGIGPSVAQEQLKQGLQSNLASAVAMGNSVRGPGAAASAGQMLANRAAAGQQMAGQAATLRAQEIAQAREQLGQVTSQGRSLDQEAHAQEAALAAKYAEMGLDADKAAMMAKLDVERMKNANYQNTAASRQGLWQRIVGAFGGPLGMLATGGGGGGAATTDTNPFPTAPQMME